MWHPRLADTSLLGATLLAGCMYAYNSTGRALAIARRLCVSLPLAGRESI